MKLNEKKNKNQPIQSEDVDNELALDAQFIDVYKNTNGVILVFDLTKNWTFEYVEKEIENIPKNIPILFLGNHRDQGHHGLPINEEKIKSFIATVERESSGQIRYVESSMRHGFGLKFLYKWFNLPFLHLKKQCLLKQLETNDRDIDACCQELSLLEESDDQNYERFLYTIQNRRRELADKLSQIPKSSGKQESNLVSKSIPFNLKSSSSNGHLNAKEILKPTPSIIIGANYTIPNYSASNNYSTKSSNSSSLNKEEKKLNAENESEDQAKLRQFLEDVIEVREELSKQAVDEESENEEELIQPKILSYQDELDPEDQAIEGEPSSILLNESESLNGLKEDDKKDELNQLESQLNNGEDKIDKKEQKKSKRISIKKENKISINLVDSLPDKTILEKDKSHSTKVKKSKKSKKSSKDSKETNLEKLSRKKSQNLEDFLGPYVTPLDEGPNENDEEYLPL